MCQPKSKGGKRCLVHASTSKYVTRVTKVKTGADEGLIKETLSELNKEGKNLPAPDPTEVKAWIDTKRFATQYDPELDSHERKIQLNQLERATEEIKSGVTGGHFHAWKNLMNVVKGKISRRIGAAAVAGLMVASLVGCFQNGGPTNPFPTEPQPTQTTSQTYVPGETVTDQYGEYQHIEVDPNNPETTLSPERSTGVTSFNQEQIQEAHSVAVDYLVTEFVDSSALDTGQQGYSDWYNRNKDTLLHPIVANDPAVVSGEAPIILHNGSTATIPVLIRDGKPRISKLTYRTTGALEGEFNGEKYITFSIDYTVDYRVSDDSATEFFAQRAGMSKEEFLNSGVARDTLKDGQENAYRATGYTVIALTPGDSGSWRIAGVQTNGQYDASSMVVSE